MMIGVKRMAEFLGVEIGEEFKINKLTYRFDEDGLYCDKYKNGKFITSELYVNTLINHKVEKSPWKPKNGESYYFISVDNSQGYKRYNFADDETDRNLVKRGVVLYRTEAEVVAEVKRLGWEVDNDDNDNDYDWEVE